MPREINIADGKVVPLSIKLVGCESAPGAQWQAHGEVDLRERRRLGNALHVVADPPRGGRPKVVRYAHVDVSGSKETSQTFHLPTWRQASTR